MEAPGAATLLKKLEEENDVPDSLREAVRQRAVAEDETNEIRPDVVGLAKSAIEKVDAAGSRVREEEAKRLDAELRARAAEERMKNMEENNNRGGGRSRFCCWRFAAFVVVSMLLAYGIGMVAFSDETSSDVLFLNPHDRSKIEYPKTEERHGVVLRPSPRSWDLMWPVHVWNKPRKAKDSTAAVVVFPFVESINSEECTFVKPDEITHGQLMGGTVALSELRTSLMYHLSTKRFTAVCAQHVGIPTCYCVLDMRKKNNTRSEEDYIELFNPTIIGFSRNAIMQVQEKNAFCKEAYWTKRFEAIAVAFLDSEGNEWERDFRGVHSYNLQHAAEIHRGLRTCLDDSSDLLIQLLRGRLGGSPERSSFERQMLFADAESWRTSRPPLPSPAPVVPLPKFCSSVPVALLVVVATLWILMQVLAAIESHYGRTPPSTVAPPSPLCICPRSSECPLPRACPLPQCPALPPPREPKWDGLAPIYPPPPWDEECRAFQVVIPPELTAPYPAFKPFQMCLRANPDVVSFNVRLERRWKDCDPLLALWRRAGGDSTSVFLDIGANIGTCSLLMLAAGVRVVAFEPLPTNLHYLTRSLFLQDASRWRSRLSLYPVGVGRAASEHTAFSEKDNAGNTVLDVPIHAQNHGETVRIRIVRLDDVLWPDPRVPPPIIAVAKIDVQGYEMEALSGAQRLIAARAIRAIHTEVAVDFLRGQNSSAHAYCSFLIDAGYKLERAGVGGAVSAEECARWDRLPNQYSVDVSATLLI